MPHPARKILSAVELASPGGDVFASVESAAQNAATSHYSRNPPTLAQRAASDYTMGHVVLHGMPLRIENPRDTYREKADRGGQVWRNRMAAHYGDIEGTVGHDGDAIDVFIGPFPESLTVWVINQRRLGTNVLDEHKVMLGFLSEQQARDAYLGSYDRGWTGLMSIVRATVPQFKQWLLSGDKSRPFFVDQLPEGKKAMQKVLWNAQAQPVTKPLHQVMYDLRVHDGKEGLLLDSVTMADLMTDPDIEGVMTLDALVVEVNQMTVKMDALKKVMESAGGTVKPTGVTISDPVKSRGVLQVMALFPMSDGQAVSVWFHNPDTTPAKLMPLDELISWKWMLNKRDVTIVVAPERGKELNVREVARRIMRLVERNSEAFKKANAKASERAAEEKALDEEIVGLEGELTGLQRQIDVARVEAEDRANRPPAVDPTTAEGYAQIKGDVGLKTQHQDQLDSMFVERIVEVRNALRGLGWVGEGHARDLTKGKFNTGHEIEAVGAGRNVVGVTFYIANGDVKPQFFPDDLSATPAELAAQIDAAAVSAVAPEPAPTLTRIEAAIQDPIANKAWELTTEEVRSLTEDQYGTILVALENAGLDKEQGGLIGKRDKIVLRSEDTTAAAIATVDAAHKFTDASEAFKLNVAASVGKTEYSTFTTAKAMDLRATELGLSIAWDVGQAVLDSAGAAGDGDDEGEDDFDENDEWDAVPETDEDGEEVDAIMDGDFKGHPFRGNQHKKAGYSSHLAVKSSVNAKRAERTGGAAEAAKAHQDAHDIHRAAAVYAKGKTKKYHKKMAKFHGARAGMNVLDSAVLDDAGATAEMVIGQIKRAAEVIGRAMIGGDGKAMVYVGTSGTERVQSPAGRPAIWSDDDAVDLLNYLVAGTTKTPDVEPPKPAAGETDASRLYALEKAAPKGAITSDDPQAIEKLQAKLAALQARQEFMKKANKFIKKGDDAGLLAMGIPQVQIDNLKKPDFVGRVGFADYQLTNNNGVISTTRKRLEAMLADRLRQQQEEAAKSTEPVAPALPDDGAPPEGRDPRDVATDPEGILVIDPNEPLPAADPAKATDTAYLQSLIEGTTDMFAPDIFERLEAMAGKYESDGDMMALLERAAQAYGDSAVKAAQAALATA